MAKGKIMLEKLLKEKKNIKKISLVIKRIPLDQKTKK